MGWTGDLSRVDSCLPASNCRDTLNTIHTCGCVLQHSHISLFTHDVAITVVCVALIKIDVILASIILIH